MEQEALIFILAFTAVSIVDVGACTFFFIYALIRMTNGHVAGGIDQARWRWASTLVKDLVACHLERGSIHFAKRLQVDWVVASDLEIRI